MTATTHELLPNSVDLDAPSVAPVLPIVPHVVDIALQLERIRVAAEQGLGVLRVCPTATNATAQLLGQIMNSWGEAESANTALANILDCKGQA